MGTVARVWGRGLPKAEAAKVVARFVSELSEPVTQRILRSFKSAGHPNADFTPMSCFIGFWPREGHATTNILCAIMQARPY